MGFNAGFKGLNLGASTFWNPRTCPGL